jgi:hypothetical protein
MQKIRTFTALMLAALWVVMGSHCLLEALPGFGLFHCETHVPIVPASGSHCDGDGCQIVESGHYFSLAARVAPVVPVSVLLFELASLSNTELPALVTQGAWDVAPPDLPTTWLFTWRAALPPRPPSLAS